MRIPALVGLALALQACDAGDDTDVVDTDTDVADTDDSDVADTDDTDATETPIAQCTDVEGTGAVTFTRDAGWTLAGTEAMSGTKYTYGLAVMPDAPEVVYAEQAGALLKSTDGGCSWAPIDALPETIWRLHAVGDGVLWGYVLNGTRVVQIVDDVVTEHSAPNNLLGFGVYADDPDHVRAVDWQGNLYDKDGGRWEQISTVPAGDTTMVYHADFDPADPDHIVVGTMVQGAWVTFDGGKEWHRADVGSDGQVNAFVLDVSPVDPNVVWMQGIDFAEETEAWEGRNVWRSDDGGLTYAKVFHQDEDVVLINGPTMAADPVDPDVLWFVFGTYYNGFGTNLYWYDHGEQFVEWTHNDHHDIASIDFSPAEPGLMYLGLVREEIFSAP